MGLLLCSLDCELINFTVPFHSSENLSSRVSMRWCTWCKLVLCQRLLGAAARWRACALPCDDEHTAPTPQHARTLAPYPPESFPVEIVWKRPGGRCRLDLCVEMGSTGSTNTAVVVFMLYSLCSLLTPFIWMSKLWQPDVHHDHMETALCGLPGLW